MAWNGTLTSTTDMPIQVLQGVNSLTNNMLGNSILLIVFLIVYFANGSDNTKEALTGASFITMLVALLLRYLSLVSDGVLALTIVASLGTLALLVMRQ